MRAHRIIGAGASDASRSLRRHGTALRSTAMDRPTNAQRRPDPRRGAPHARRGLLRQRMRLLRRPALLLLLGLGLAGCATAPPAPVAPAAEQAPKANAGPQADAAPHAAPPAGLAEGEAPAAPVQAGADAARPGILERTRNGVRDATEWLARGIDSWFGDEPFPGERRVSAGRLGLRTTWRQDDGWELIGRFNVRLDLPNAREKAYVLIGRENERELITDKPDAFSRQEQLLQEKRSDQSFFVGLGVPLRESIEMRVGIRGGYKLYAQARYREQWQLAERDRVEFKETVFWTVVDGFGSTTALSYDHAFAPNLSLRWLTAGTFSQKTDGLAWSSSLGLYRGFGQLRLLSLEALINGETGRPVDVTEYGIRTRWEQPIYRDWLLGEVIVGHFWPRKDAVTERGRSWAVGLGVQMRF